MRFKIVAALLLFVSHASFADINVRKVSADLSKNFGDASIWKDADAAQELNLIGQPAVVPKPKKAETTTIHVTAVHDGKWIAFRIRWKDREINEAGKLATFSDAVALQFPIVNNEQPPSIMMGDKGDPVHLFHWRYQYQLDATKGKKEIGQIYPNMTVDMYPLDYKQKGNYKEASEEQKNSFVGGTAAGNPQSFPKKSGVDEIFAEGFGTTAVQDSHLAQGFGEWKNGEWTVVIARPLTYETGSKLYVGKKSHVAFAVWQGGKKEVGSLKSLTIVWTPLHILSE